MSNHTHIGISQTNSHLGWDKVKVGDRVKYHSPVQGHHEGIVVKVLRHHASLLSGIKSVYVQPLTTAAYTARGEISHELMTVNHSLWSIY